MIGVHWHAPADGLTRRQAARARIFAGEGFIYAAEVVGADTVKIGFSLDPGRRMKAMYVNGTHGGVRLLKFVPGSWSLEMQLHRDLREHEIGSELYPRAILNHPACRAIFSSPPSPPLDC